jgi:cytidyltransferase-like protein
MIVITSGGFDPLHTGHLNMLEAAYSFGMVVVLVNTDEWLLRKKGKFFMPLVDRIRLVRALKVVAEAEVAIDYDDSVSESLWSLRKRFPETPLVFANGGDRVHGNTPEEWACKENDIHCLYGVGGGKTEASSELLKRYAGK